MRKRAVGMAVLTTILWAGSYILNKLAFEGGIGPLTLSGLRYLLASLILFAAGAGGGAKRGGARLEFRYVVLLGILGYAVAQGLQYMGQSRLTPTQSSLFLSVGNTTLVMLVDRLWLRENQTARDLAKLLVLVGGIALYYYPWGAGALSLAGLAFMLLSSVGYALNMTINRRLLTSRGTGARELVAKPMLFGACVLVVAGLIVEGLPTVTVRLLLILAYLSGVSGALGFFLWTKSQATLTAFESSAINNLMLIEIALMDFIAFRRAFSAAQIAAILVIFGAILSIQRRTGKKDAE